MSRAPSFSITRALPFVALLGLTAAAFGGGCNDVEAEGRIGIVAPDPDQFPPVANLLDHRCGSLDCHGTMARNLRMWGCEGMRLEDAAALGCRRMGGTDTTLPEYDQSYRSLVALEPNVMSVVVRGGGQRPDLLTFVRKARGDEAHKGGTLIVPGDSQDICITSWLAGTTNTDACTQALADTP